MNDTQVILRLVISAILAGFIGVEREWYGRMAGFRTHILVAVGSCLIMLTSIHIFDIYSVTAPVDSGRIAAGVVTGIGFLGAGTIMRFRASVIGLTTAASLWAVSGIGLAVGSGFYVAAYTCTALVLIALIVFGRIEKRYIRKNIYRVLTVKTKGDYSQLNGIRSVLSAYNVETRDYEFDKKDIDIELLVMVTAKLASIQELDKIMSDLMKIEGVRSAGWE